jgi:hypothetical protein
MTDYLMTKKKKTDYHLIQVKFKWCTIIISIFEVQIRETHEFNEIKYTPIDHEKL